MKSTHSHATDLYASMLALAGRYKADGTTAEDLRERAEQQRREGFSVTADYTDLLATMVESED